MPQKKFKLKTCIIPQGNFGISVANTIQNRDIGQQIDIIESSQQNMSSSALSAGTFHLCFAACETALRPFLKVWQVAKKLKAYQTVFVTNLPPFSCLHVQRFLEPNQWVLALPEPEGAKTTSNMVAYNIIQDIHSLFSENLQMVSIDLSDILSTAKGGIHWGFSFEGCPKEVMDFLNDSKTMIRNAPGIILVLAFDPSYKITLDKITEFADVVQKYAKEEADIIWGVTHSHTIPGVMRVSLILRQQPKPDLGSKKIWYGQRPSKADEISRERDLINPIMINQNDIEEKISMVVQVEMVDQDINHPDGFQVDIYGKSNMDGYINCVSLFKSDEKALAQKLVSTVRPGTEWLVTGEPLILIHLGITVIQAHFYQAVKPFVEDDTP
jgi:hypothetical protein